MLSIVKSMSLLGLDGFLIYVQVDVSAGIPGWDIVGLPDTSVKEAKERVRTAIKNSGYELQSRKIIVNLAPADTKKEGSAFDLPIAIGILLCTEVIGQIPENIAFIGELSLDGKINKVNGVLPMCIEAKKLGINQVVLPKENAQEAAVVEDLNVYGFPTSIRPMTYNGKMNVGINDAFFADEKFKLPVDVVGNETTDYDAVLLYDNVPNSPSGITTPRCVLNQIIIKEIADVFARINISV